MKFFTKHVFLAALCLLTLHIGLNAQNLVLNPSFENAPPSSPFVTCPGFGDLVNWDRVETDTCSTPDLFSPACSGIFGILGSPSNNFGNQNAHTGTNYVGFFTRDIGPSDYREYIQGKVSAPLVAGQQYCVSFYVSFPENVTMAANRMGLYFSNSHITANMCVTEVLPYTPQLQACTSTIITDRTNWVRLQWDYTAAGGETYFVIGNFFNNAATTTSNTAGSSFFGAYYYVDDVSVMSGTCCYKDVNAIAPLCQSSGSVTLNTAAPVLNANCTTTTSAGTWSGAGITNSVTGVFTPSAAGVGVHTLSLSLACGFTQTTTVTVNPCLLSVCHTGSVLTASGGTAPYTWQAQTTYTDCSGCPGGNCIPFFCAGNVVTTWTTVATNTNTFNATSFPIKLLDNAGNTFTVTNLSSLPTCTVTASCPTLTLSVASQTNVNCFGASTGSATVNASGGTGPYTYTWTPGLTGASQSALAAGTYTVFITDGASCPGSGTVSITQPASALSSSVAGTTPAACGQTNGSATISATGGTAGYTYSWAPNGGTAASSNSLAAGSYSVMVTDSKGCTVSIPLNVSSAGGPTLSVLSQTNVNCFGASTGTATVNSTGGTGPYTYTWAPGNLTGASQTGLAAGIYTITTSDLGGCIGNGTLSITQPGSAITASLAGSTQATCGQTNGSATISATGGTAGYTYNWTPNGGTAASSNSLAAGTYSVVVTDGKGCTVSTPVNISSASGPTLSVVSQTNVNCFGANTGTATLNSTGGTGPYTYTWVPGNLSGSSQTGLAAGIYTITTSDVGGCIGNGTVSITQPASAVTASLLGTVPAACGQANGSATISASGGTPGYTYVWLPSGGTSASSNSLTAGAYSVITTDSKNCNNTTVITITSSSGPTVSVASQTNVNCFGATTGTATVNSTGGTAPYTYTWTPGNLTGASQTGLAAGTYTILTKDLGGCVGSGTILITQAPALTASIIATVATSCGGSTGAATVSAGGGSPGYTYSWSPGGGTAVTASGLPAGNYNVTVTDSKNCTATANAVINSASGPTLTVSSQLNVSCFGANTGSASVAASGGSGSYTYTWMPGNSHTASASNLSAGLYSVTVSDGNCLSFTVVTITQATAMTGTVTTTDASCASSDGSAVIAAGGGAGAYTYTWSTGATTQTVINLPGGNYSVTIKDAAGCTNTVTGVVAIHNGGFFIDAGTGALIESGGSAALNGNTFGEPSFTWTPGGSLSCTNCLNPIASPGQTTTYTLTATNSSGCLASDTVTIFVETPCGDLFIPTAFSPNNDGQNDVLKIYGNCITGLEFAIYDRWGEKVFFTTDPTQPWDGSYQGKLLDPAAFAYYFKATVNGEEVKKHGSVSIVK